MQTVTPQNRGKKKRRPGFSARRRRALFFIALAAVLAIIIYFVLIRGLINVGGGSYHNVYVNGVSLNGYTKKQAQSMFNTILEDWSTREHALTYGENAWHFSARTIDAKLDINTQLDLAWNIGNYGSAADKRDAIKLLESEPRYFVTELEYNEEKLNEFISDIQLTTDIEPVDAVVILDVDAPKVLSESQDGMALNVEKTKETILEILKTGVGDATLEVNKVTPVVSSNQASGGLTMIASYYTDMTASSYNRYINVQLALSYFNGLAVYPGDTISFNTVVGERTEERGFKEAPEYSGTTVINGIGGGSCQASTTLYCAAMVAGMSIIERHPHNMMVSYADPSLDATVNYGSKDFVFRNDTEHTVYIYTKVNRKRAWVVMYGAEQEYYTEFRSVVLEKSIEATKRENREDVTAQYVYYTDEEYLFMKGKDGCVSQGWLVYIDWTTGDEVKSVQVSQDSYTPGTSIYYVGIHERTAMPELSPEPGVFY